MLIMKSNWQLKSNVFITVRRKGVVIERFHRHNLITNAGIALLRDSILGNNQFVIERVAFGDGSAAPDVADTQLVNELLRVDILRRQVVDSKTALTTAYIEPALGNDFKIEEVGWFAGGATDDPNTGSMISRVLYSHQKTNLESIQIDRFDTFASV